VVSVGQQAFVGLGAYSMIALVNVPHQNLYASVPLSGLVAAVLSIPIGLIAFRLRGSYFAIGTWVIAEAISLIVILQKSVGAGNGVSLKVAGYSLATRQDNSYWFALVVGVGSVLLTYLVLRSRLGLQMQAIRDSEEGARGLGANVYRTRFLVWVLAAFWTGLAGATYYLQQLRVQPAGTGGAFSVVQWTAPIVFIVVIGGIGTIEGPIIGTLVYFLLREFLADYGTIYLLLLVALAIVVMLAAPKGLWGYAAQRFGWSLFPVGYRITWKD
jgi:branched-chain amino acid transport system permease protein